MAIISKNDFDSILNQHGEDAYLIQIDEKPKEDQSATSPFDMIYGFADSGGEAGSGATETKRPFKCLIQEVQTGQEAWVSKVGTLEVGDAVMFCKVSYTDDNGTFLIKSSDLVESSVRGHRYIVEKPAHNIDGNSNIFFQVILRKKQS